MEHLFGAWSELEPCLKDRPVIIFLDYDGTLTPIVDRPELAELSSEERSFLSEMSRVEGLQIVILSGRSLIDVKEKVCLPGILYAGNHGLEFENSESFHIHPEALLWKNTLHKLRAELMKAFKAYKEILIEDKVFTLSVHYRLLGAKNEESIYKILLSVLAAQPDFSKLFLTHGKKVWEIRPPISWDKGAALLWMLDQASAHAPVSPFPVYAGDDWTDEDAFKILNDRGLGIKITRYPQDFSYASHYLSSPAELFEFLRKLVTLKKGKEKSHAEYRASKSF